MVKYIYLSSFAAPASEAVAVLSDHARLRQIIRAALSGELNGMATRVKSNRADAPPALSFVEHPTRAMALGEVHARPFPEIAPNSVLIHFAFASTDGGAGSREVMARLCAARGAAQPDPSARYHAIDWGKGMLRWERHAEFSTFLWDGPAPERFMADVEGHPFNGGFAEAGQLVASCRVEVRKQNAENMKLLERFEKRALCVNVLEDGESLIATDFRQDASGMTVFLMLEDNMKPWRIGFFSKNTIELETYRILALFGLPLAQQISAGLSRFEAELGRLTTEMRAPEPEKGQVLLDQMTRLAAELEADSAISLFRFGATRAYGDIFIERIAALGNGTLPGHKTFGTFLERRIAPALRTCRSVEERQANLSLKLSRAADLLRTRVEVEMANQNRNLLNELNRRGRQQLQLQRTVEGLSVAAVSYYIVGLFYYLAKAAKDQIPGHVSPEALTGLFVPFALLFVGLTVRRIRKSHFRED
jgi:uncharacterized membrane-anchored protein